MQSLEQIVAQNLTELRKAKKWTQAELADKINYSDKSVSKWERGEGLPDLKVLKQMADLFGVTVDFFVTENAALEKEKYTYPKSERNYRFGVALMAVSIVWLIAVVVFVYAAVYSKWIWMAFVWAVPASAMMLSTLFKRWGYRVTTIVFRSVLCWSLLASVYLQFLVSRGANIWMIFLIGIPTQAALILWVQLRHNRA